MNILYKIFIYPWLNQDRGNMPPEDYKPDSPLWWRQFMYFFIRNPLHNFTWYVVGLAGKEFQRYKYNREIKKYELVDEIKYFEKEKFLRAYLLYNETKYPFVSYLHYWGSERKLQFYAGFRPHEGALGFKLRPWTKGIN